MLSLATIATGTGGASSARVNVQPQKVCLDNAHFVMKVPDRGHIVFKAEVNADGKMMFVSVNEVDQPVEVLERLQQYLLGPQQWFQDLQNLMIIDASTIPSVVTDAEMMPPTGAVDFASLKCSPIG